jgi:uncharacterized protein (TIGR03437 family)
MAWVRQFGTSRVDSGVAVSHGEFGVYTAGNTIGVFPGQPAAGLNDRDAFLSLHDEAGNLKWIRRVGSPTLAEDYATGVAADGSGAYVVGHSAGPIGSQLVGGVDAFIRKYDADGNVLWTRQFGTVSDDYILGVAAHTSGVYVVGYIDCCGATLPGFPATAAADAFVRKYDGNGNEVWTRLFGTQNTDHAVSVAVDSTGVYVAGTTNGQLGIGSGGTDGFVRKFDLDGAVVWTRQFGAVLPNGNATNDDLVAVAVGTSGVYVSGATSNQATFPGQTFSGGLWDAYVAKFDTNGAPQWIRQFGSSGDDYANAIAVGAGHVLVGGSASGALPGQTFVGNDDAFYRLYDLDGAVLSTRQFGNGSNDSVQGVAAYGGGFFAGGLKNGIALNLEPIGDNDSFLMKLIPPPFVPDAAVVNAASFAAPPAPLAPGSMAIVFGAYLNDGPQVLSTIIGQDGKVATSLGGTSITVNNVPAPILYSLNTQIAFQIPFEVAGQTTASVVVNVGGQSSVARTINIATAAAGIFTVNQAGTMDAIVVHSDGVTLVTPQNPARRGEVVVLYCTGLGVQNPALGTGVPAGASFTIAPVVLLFGVTNATIEYAGAAPGFVGLNQINATIPATSQTGNTVPLLLSVAGRQANVATIAIAP